MEDVQKAAALSAVRTILGVIGGALTAKGYMDDTNVQLLIGAFMTLIPVGWGIVEKYRSERKTVERAQEAYNAGAAGMPDPTITTKGPAQ